MPHLRDLKVRFKVRSVLELAHDTMSALVSLKLSDVRLTSLPARMSRLSHLSVIRTRFSDQTKHLCWSQVEMPALTALRTDIPPTVFIHTTVPDTVETLALHCVWKTPKASMHGMCFRRLSRLTIGSERYVPAGYKAEIGGEHPNLRHLACHCFDVVDVHSSVYRGLQTLILEDVKKLRFSGHGSADRLSYCNICRSNPGNSATEITNMPDMPGIRTFINSGLNF